MKRHAFILFGLTIGVAILAATVASAAQPAAHGVAFATYSASDPGDETSDADAAEDGAAAADAGLATAATTRMDIAGPTGICGYSGSTASRSVGRAEISTSTAASAGFHPVRVHVKVRAHRLAPGSYRVWLVQLYRDGAGAVVGCAASPFADLMTVASGRSTDFRGAVDRYTGTYELQVYVGPLWSPGYATPPATIDVP